MNLTTRAQSNRNLDFLVPVIDFVQSVERFVTAHRKRAGSGDEIIIIGSAKHVVEYHSAKVNQYSWAFCGMFVGTHVFVLFRMVANL